MNAPGLSKIAVNLTLLESTAAESTAGAENKGLVQKLRPFDAPLTKRTGGS